MGGPSCQLKPKARAWSRPARQQHSRCGLQGTPGPLHPEQATSPAQRRAGALTRSSLTWMTQHRQIQHEDQPFFPPRQGPTQEKGHCQVKNFIWLIKPHVPSPCPEQCRKHRTLSGVRAQPGAAVKLVVTPWAETQTDPQVWWLRKREGHHHQQGLSGSSHVLGGWGTSFRKPSATTPARVVPPDAIVEHGPKGQPSQIWVEQSSGRGAHPVPGHGGGCCQPTRQQDVHQSLWRH